jgi:hypothetical protein
LTYSQRKKERKKGRKEGRNNHNSKERGKGKGKRGKSTRPRHLDPANLKARGKDT